MKPKSRSAFRNPFLNSALAAAAMLGSAALHAEDLTFSGTGTVRLLATDWADYTGGSGSFNVGANDGGRLYWRGDAGAGDGQYIHFDLTRLSGLTVSSDASVTLQGARTQWGGSVTDSFIATANGSWTAAYGAAVPGATAISGATNATGNYSENASVTWGIGQSTFQGYVTNASSFNGLAIIGGAGSTMHFWGPMNPYLEVTTNANMTGVVTVSGGDTWNASNYSFTNGVLTINDSVASSAGAVTINSLGTVFVNGNGGDNRYWSIGSTTINAGGVLVMQGHSHIHNLTLAGGELAGIRPNGSWGSWSFDDATNVTATSTISAQQMNFDNGNFTVSSGATLNVTGSIRSGSIIKAGAGSMVLSNTNAGSGGITINGGTLVAAKSAQDHGIHTLGSGNITVNNGGTLRSTAQWSTSSEWNGTSVGSVTINNGGTWAIEAVGQTIRNGLFLNGGSITAIVSNADWGALHLKSGVTAGGGVTSTIGADTALSGSQTITVDSGSQLNYSGVIHNQYGTSSGINKAGAGTLVLSGANSYSGVTNINAGMVVAAHSTALGPGGWNGATMTWVYDGGTLALQGGISLDEHMHVFGAGVGGLGAIRSLSGNNSLTLTYNGGGSGPGFSIDSNTTVGVDADSLTVTGFYESGGSFGLTKVGDGTLVLSSYSTYTGATTISGGKVAMNHASALQYSAYNTTGSNGSTIGLDVTNGLNSGSLTVGGLSGSVNLDSAITAGYGSVSSLVLNPQSGSSVTYSGSIADGATGMSLTKAGAGTQVLGGSSSYSGVTVLEGGILNAASIADNGTNSSLGVGTGDPDANTIGLLFRGGTLQYTGSTAQSTNRAIRLSTSGGTIDASGSDPAATLSFTAASSPNLFENPGGRTLTLTGSNTGNNTFGMALSDAGGGTAVVKNGSGTWVLGGNSSHTGGTWINGGTLRLDNTAALGGGGLNMANGTTLQLRADSDATFAGGNGLGGLGGASITIDVNQLTSGNSNKTLSFATGGFNTYLTTVNVTGGNGYTLALGGINEGFGGSLSLNANSANLNIANIGSSSAVSSLSVGGDANTTITGAINSSGGLSKSGNGMLTLSGNSSYSGGTTVTAGKLVVNGDNSGATGTVTIASGATLGGSGTVGGATTIQNGGHLAVGNSPGIQTFSSTLDLQSGSIFDWDLAGNTNSGRGSNYDGVDVTGTLTIASDAVFRVIQNTGLDFNDTFWDTSRTWTDIFSAGTLTSNWSNAAVEVYNTSNVLQNVSSFGSFTISGSTLTWTAVPEPTSALAGLLVAAGLLRRRRVP